MARERIFLQQPVRQKTLDALRTKELVPVLECETGLQGVNHTVHSGITITVLFYGLFTCINAGRGCLEVIAKLRCFNSLWSPRVTSLET